MNKVEQKYYYKATKANGVSGYDPNFKYHLGLNIHPNPDRASWQQIQRLAIGLVP